MRETKMTVSLGAIGHNARLFRQRIPNRVRMMCVIKADAYGHGAIDAARVLLQNGADAFAVAIVEEAQALRDVGISCPILILGGSGESSLRQAVHLNVAQAVYTPKMLDILEDEAARIGVPALAHLKIDTGMSRIGVRESDDLSAMLAYWRRCPDVRMEGVFTHFSVADTDPAFTEVQRRRFADALNQIHSAGYHPIAHAAATSAMFNSGLQFDMVRPGIGLYGTGVPELKNELQYAQRLTTMPIRIQRINAGDSVGYGRTFTAKRDSLIMTLPIGYGDGYPRILSNRADVLVCGRRAPVVGRVCMDMIMADITDIPEVTLEDEVVLMGRQGDEIITPDELAERSGTIPYEIMLGFSKRVRVIREN